MRLSSVIGWVLTDIMKQAIEEGWADKIELFKQIYTVNKKFNNKSILYIINLYLLGIINKLNTYYYISNIFYLKYKVNKKELVKFINL